MTTQNFTEEQLFSRLRDQLESGEISKEQAEQAIYAFRNKVTPEAARQETMPEGNVVSGTRETATAALGGVAGQIASGWAGLGAMMPGGRSPAEAVEATQQWFAEKSAPKTQAGQKGVETLGDVMEMGVDVARMPLSGLAGLTDLLATQSPDQAAQTVQSVKEKGLSQTIGDRVMEQTGSPILSTVAYLTPEIAASVVPVARMRQNRSNFQEQLSQRIMDTQSYPEISNTLSQVSSAVRSGDDLSNLPTALQAMRGQTPKRIQSRIDQVADDIEAGVPPASVANQIDQIAREASVPSPDTQLVRYVKDGAGKIKSDPLAVEALKQGFDEGVVAVVKAATPEDRSRMLRMMDTMQRRKRNPSLRDRPIDVAGESLLSRVNQVKKANKEAGDQLESVAKGLKGETVNAEPAVGGFISRLENMGVKIDEDFKLDFVGSDVEGVKGAENVLKNIAARIPKKSAPNGYDLHRLKKYIDEQVTYGKSAEGLAGEAERTLKALRHDIDSALDSQFPKYDQVNTTYSDTISALDSLKDVAGSKMDLFGPNSDKAVGTLLRRLEGNAQSRVPLMDAIDQVDTIARRYGGEYSDDIMSQVMFANNLDTVFAPVARTSFEGSVGQGVRQGGELLTGQKTGMGILMEYGQKFADRAKGINEEGAMTAIMNLLERQ